MPYYKLKEESPLVQTIRELEHFMDENDIQISSGLDGQLFIRHKGEYYHYRDIEQSAEGYETTGHFPLGFETKLIIEKDN